MSDRHKDWDRKAWLAFFLLMLTIAALAFNHLGGCSVKSGGKNKDPAPAPREDDPKPCGELVVGDTKEEACEGGIKLFVCTKNGLEKKADTCKTTGGGGGACVKYSDVEGILGDNCVSCHRGKLDDYAIVKQWADKIVSRVTKVETDRTRMPPPPADPLSKENQALLVGFRDGGAVQSCPTGGGGSTFIDLDYLEATILQDLNRMDATKRVNVRYLVTAHKLNEQGAPEEFARYAEANSKTLNSLNLRDGRLRQPEAVDAAKTIWRFDLEDFGLSVAKWDFVERNDKLKVVSSTDIGLILQQLTRTEQPWMHADNFIDVTQRNAEVYYALTNTPASLFDLSRNLGVDLAGDLRDLDVIAAGGNKSPISLLKNRLIVRWESDDGYMWVSFDPVDLAGVPQRNLFEFPLLRDVGGERNFRFDASEVIYSLRNGLQGYALFNAAGARQNAAPLNIVADNRSPVTPEIKNAVSCHRCHANGVIPMEDQVRAHVVANAAQFPARDVDLVKGIYETAPVLTATFAGDQKTFNEALGAAGISTALDDPINHVLDRFLLDWDINRTASFLLLTVDGFKDCLGQSAVAKAQIGQLLTGGTVTYLQFVEVLPTLVKDCLLFQEPID